MATHFSGEALKFLRGLKRNNDRVWFEARRGLFEKELKEPMLKLIGEVNQAMAEFAPMHVRPPQKIMMRIYRDIRFSKDKRPYKNHVSAWWVSARLRVERAMKATLLKDVVERFRAAAPMIAMLNAPLVGKPKRPMF